MLRGPSADQRDPILTIRVVRLL